MPIDRDSTLKTAEKLLRQGKLDGAIAEYVRLIDDQPRDWSSINALGDLYVRAGDGDRAIAQFTRIADHLFTEGFLPKAAALYKKALKINVAHEHTLLRLSEIATQQGLLTDATMYLRQLLDRHRAQNNERGAAECVMRLGALEDADGDAKLAAAQAARALNDSARAAVLLEEASNAFTAKGRHGEALDALVEAALLDPRDGDRRARVVHACVEAGQPDRARPFLTFETAGEDPDLLLALARIELAAGDDAAARAVLGRIAVLAPDRSDDIVQVAEMLADDGRHEAASACVDIVVDSALLDGDYARAIDVLQDFLRHGHNVPGLVRLVEMCVDAGLDAPMRVAQAHLADAYLESGHGTEARVIAEDLLAADPHHESHRERLRRACALLGVLDVDAVLAQYLEASPDLGEWDLSDVPSASTSGPPDAASAHVIHMPASEPAEAVQRPSESPVASGPEDGDNRVARAAGGSPSVPDVITDTIEFDLSDALAGMKPTLSPPVSAPVTLPASPSRQASSAAAGDLEAVFEEMRVHATEHQHGSDSAAQFALGTESLAQGRAEAAIEHFARAARFPGLRFAASARLGSVYLGRGDMASAIDWLERAAEAPHTSAEEGCAVLYDLADALERTGETARALAVLLELNADLSGYRDVASRIEHLTRLQGRSHEG